MASSVPTAQNGIAIEQQRQFAFALMAVAGWCDAAGFLLFTQLYVSFMSGDATQLGVNAASGHWYLAAKLLSIQALFVVGAAVGRYYRLIHPRSGRRGILLANFVLLGLTAFFGARAMGLPTFGLAVFAMGMQNAAITHEASVLVGTMVTGALVRLGFGIADRATKRDAQIGDNFGQWACFVGGAVGGAVVFARLGAGTFWIPAVASLLLVPIARRLPAMVEKPLVSAT